MSRIESARKSYMISDAWLEHFGQKDNHAHCDLAEIARNQSVYLDWIVANEGANRDRERIKAAMDCTTIAFFEGEDEKHVKCELWDDEGTPRVRSFWAGYIYELAMRRVYAWGTTARRIEFLGYGQKRCDL